MASISDNAGILFRIKADSSDARRDINAVQNDLGGLTNASGLAASGFASMLNPVTLTVGAIAAVGTAAIATAVGLFNLAKSASDYGSELFDAQQKTGLSAATLGTLKLAADNAGSSFDGVSNSVSKFAVLLGKANQDNVKANETLAKYGVTARDLPNALNQAITAIAQQSDESKQAAASAELFKDKTLAMIPVALQLGGDLQKATEDAKRLGLVLGEDDVKAADDFGDAMGVLSAQVQSASAKFALQYAPQITAAIQSISEFLARNQDAAYVWGQAIADVLRGVAVMWQVVTRDIGMVLDALGIKFESSASQAKFWAEAILLAINPVLALAMRIGAVFRENAGLAAGVNKIGSDGTVDFSTPNSPLKENRLLGSSLSSATTGGGKATRPPKETDSEFRKFFTDQGFRVVRTQGRAINPGSPHTFGGAADISVIGKSAEQIFALMAKALEKGYRVFDERVKVPGVKHTGPHIHFENAKTTLSKKSGFNESKFAPNELAYLQELDKQRLGKASGRTGLDTFTQKNNDASAKEKAEREKLAADLAEIEIRYAEDTEQRKYEIGQRTTDFLISEAERAGDAAMDAGQWDEAIAKIEEVAALRLQSYRDELTELERVRVAQQALADAVDGAKDPVQKRKLQIAVDETWHKIQIKTIDLQNAEAASAVGVAKGIKDVNAARQESIDKLEEERKKRQELADADYKNWKEKKERDEIEAEAGRVNANPFKYLIDGYKEFINTVQTSAPTLTETIQGIGGLFVNAFSGMANAIGGLVQSWVLLGTAGPNAMRKMLASVLATLAAEAAVQALMQLAYGFVALAFGNGAAATQHFIAAAIFGGVAGVAAVAGRAIAGDSFKQQTDSATGQGGGSGTGQQAAQNNNFGGVFNGFQQQQAQQSGALATIVDRLNVVVGGVQEQFEMFNQKFGIATSSDVVMAGAGGASGAIFDANLAEMETGGRPTEQLARVTGRYR